MTLYVTDDSPRELTDGEWVVVKGVARWVPAPPKPEPVRVIPTEGVACPTCLAVASDWCRAASGKPRPDHAARTSLRTCVCGEPPRLPKARYCEECHVEARRNTYRLRAEKRWAEAATREQVAA